MTNPKDITVKTDLSFDEAMKALARADKTEVDKAMSKLQYPVKKAKKATAPKKPK